ncbi:hypothetical protein GQ42DRAFT_165502 [Ramicandelaber brevisporus]|nr:hypothetical protein GQ42DRAFT_165502 [Ramicandelaber brevisporus]
MSFKYNVPGVIQGDFSQIKGRFNIENGTVVAFIKLNTPIGYDFQGPEAFLEYNNIDDFNGPFYIEPDSVIGPGDLRLSIRRVDADIKVKITARVSPPLPSGLDKGGIVSFHIEDS